MPQTCLLTKHTNPNTYTASPGTLTLILTPVEGSVTFDCGTTNVTDSNGKGPNGYNCATDKLTFQMNSGNTYTVDPFFVFAADGDTAELKENCAAPVLDDLIVEVFTPIYTILVK